MKTYVIHCERCKRLILKEDKDLEDCPPEPESRPLELRCPAVHTMKSYYDKFQNREFRTRKQLEGYCKERNLYKPTQTEIRQHREEYQVSGPKAYKKGTIYN